MKQFELTLVRRDVTNSINPFLSLDKIEADDLVHLLSQLLFVIVNLQNKIHKEQMELRGVIDDDIPF